MRIHHKCACTIVRKTSVFLVEQGIFLLKGTFDTTPPSAHKTLEPLPHTCCCCACSVKTKCPKCTCWRHVLRTKTPNSRVPPHCEFLTRTQNQTKPRRSRSKLCRRSQLDSAKRRTCPARALTGKQEHTLSLLSSLENVFFRTDSPSRPRVAFRREKLTVSRRRAAPFWFGRPPTLREELTTVALTLLLGGGGGQRRIEAPPKRLRR